MAQQRAWPDHRREQPGLPGRIDVHAHYVPASTCKPPCPPRRSSAASPLRNPEAALEMMDRQGIEDLGNLVDGLADRDVRRRRCCGAEVARSSNEVAAEAIRSHPGRFGGFACTTSSCQDVDAALAEDRLRRAGDAAAGRRGCC